MGIKQGIASKKKTKQNTSSCFSLSQWLKLVHPSAHPLLTLPVLKWLYCKCSQLCYVTSNQRHMQTIESWVPAEHPHTWVCVLTPYGKSLAFQLTDTRWLFCHDVVIDVPSNQGLLMLRLHVIPRHAKRDDAITAKTHWNGWHKCFQSVRNDLWIVGFQLNPRYHFS